MLALEVMRVVNGASRRVVVTLVAPQAPLLVAVAAAAAAAAPVEAAVARARARARLENSPR